MAGAVQTEEIKVKVVADAKEFERDMAPVLAVVESIRKHIDAIVAKIPKVTVPKLPTTPASPVPNVRPAKPVPKQDGSAPSVSPAVKPAIDAVTNAVNESQQAHEKATDSAQEHRHALDGVTQAAKEAAQETYRPPDMGKIGKPYEAVVRDILNRARGVGNAAAGVVGTSAKEWERYRRVALQELEAVQRKAAQAQAQMHALQSQLFSRDSAAADEFIRMSLAAGWSDEQIEQALAQKEAASAATKAGQAYATAQAQLRQYSEAIEQATQKLQGLNAQVEASRKAETVAKQQAAAAREQAAAAREQARAMRQEATARASAAKQQAATSLQMQKQGMAGLGALTGIEGTTAATSAASLIGGPAGWVVFGLLAILSALRAASRLIISIATSVMQKLGSAMAQLGTSLWAAAHRNEQFRASIAQVKGNLAVAFQSIYIAVLPALQQLSQWLAIATNWLAQFTATLFGVSYGAAVKGAKDQTEQLDEIGGAAKRAKRALTGFDELNILSFASGGGGVKKSDENRPKFTLPFKLPDWIKNLNFSKAIESWENFKKALKPLGEKAVKAWEWFKINILEPFAKWTIERALPATLDLLSAATTTLSTAIDVLKPAGQWLWENFLKPLGEWTGDIIIRSLEGAKEKFEALTNWLKKNPDTAVKIAKILFAMLPPVQLAIWLGLAQKALEDLGAAFNTAGKLGKLAWGTVQTAWFEAKVWFIQRALDIKNAFAGLPTTLQYIFMEAWQKVSNTWAGIKTAILTPIEDAKKRIKEVIDTIKGYFNFKINWPKLKVPKLTITFDTSAVGVVIGKALGLKGIPKLSITWAAQGGMLNSAQLIGAGEAGRELLLPLDRHTGWMDDLAERVFARMSSVPIEIVVESQANIDGEVVYRNVVRRAEQERRRTGLAPLPV
jgi:hypothetical protein